jgi:hypothetical protein
MSGKRGTESKPTKTKAEKRMRHGLASVNLVFQPFLPFSPLPSPLSLYRGPLCQSAEDFLVLVRLQDDAADSFILKHV